ncbi:MAG: four-carbon acid sugar kinase family protein [Deltaproteobacteria bacterium]|nr:four-carbon acid sugar kinase family protein [Deltaproteobacteria bacterium]
MNPLLLAFYGDDFTGSADAMEALTINGVKTALFLGHPTQERLNNSLPNLQAVGISGVSRTMTPEQMDDELPDQLALLNSLNPRLIHYKVCATFDSSPTIGSIGHAADIAFRIINPAYGVIVQGVPLLGRYIVFGNHFTVYGDQRYRLDRHPVMSKHPITPMREGDLRFHFGMQSKKKVKLIDLLHLKESFDSLSDRFDRYAEDSEIILFDTLDDKNLLQIGQLLNDKSRNGSVFAVGSSGFEYAMASYWREKGIVEEPKKYPSIGPVDQLIVVSGSAAANTAEQIKYAVSHRFENIVLQTDLLADEQTAADERNRVIRESLGYLKKGKSILLSATIGPDDPIIEKTRDRVRQLGIDKSETGKIIGRQQGLILRELLEATGLRRVCVAGGDTCSYTLRQLDIHSLELLMPIAPAAPLCLAFSDNPAFDNLQVASKGGQIGSPDYFIQVLEGRR